MAMLSFSGLLFADALTTNSAYRAIAAHRVSVSGTGPSCFLVPYRSGVGGGTFYARYCRATYAYGGRTFTAVTPTTWPLVFEVDSKDPSIRMDKVLYEHGPANVAGDIVGAILLLLGAATITAVHQLHHRRWRRERQTESRKVNRAQ